MNRAKVNYWVDVVTGLALVASGASGLVFLLPGEPASDILGIKYQVWSDLHTWGSLAMVAGVCAHLSLHWRWMVSMTRHMLSRTARGRGVRFAPSPVTSGAAEESVSRRAFLALSGAAVLTTGLAVGSARLLTDGHAAGTSGDGETPAAGEQVSGLSRASGVACPFGLVNDPYRGRCRFYADSNGDGICDYSVTGSSDNLTVDRDGGWGGGSRHRGQTWGQP